MKIVIYKSPDGYRWRAVRHNGRIVADSGEAYASLSNAKRAATRLFKNIQSGKTKLVFYVTTK